MGKERRLGRGLAALLGEPEDMAAPMGPARYESESEAELRPRIHQPEEVDGVTPTDSPDAKPPTEGDERLIQLNVHEIDENPFQPRREFGTSEIASLAESLKEHDMLQPVLVRRVGDRWQLISGERRLRAAIHAGWTTVPAQVRDADDRLVAELAIVENLQRKDLNPLEKALSFQRYLREHECTQEDLGKRIKIDRSTIANLLRLLELPDLVQNALRGGSISAGHARALLPLGEEGEQIDFCNRIRREGLSVRDTERFVQERIKSEDEGGSTATRKKSRTQSPQIDTLEQELRALLGTRVEIRQTSRGSGRIIVHFRNNDEFDRIRVQIAGT